MKRDSSLETGSRSTLNFSSAMFAFLLLWINANGPLKLGNEMQVLEILHILRYAATGVRACQPAKSPAKQEEVLSRLYLENAYENEKCYNHLNVIIP